MQPPSTTTRKRPRLRELAKVSLIEVLDAGEDVGTRVTTDAVHWRRETYLPLRHGELRRKLVADDRLTLDEKQSFLQLCKLLSATFHYEYLERIQQLKGEYEPFDPDSLRDDGGTRRSMSDEDRERNVRRLFDKLTDLLERANYHPLTQAQIEQAVAAASDWGVRLEVDFRAFARLEVYARGDVIGRRTRHRWQRLFIGEEVDVPIYQRVAVLFRMQTDNKSDRGLDPHAVYIKLFKNIPKEDVDMMLPGARAKFSKQDLAMLVAPAIAGMGYLAWRQFQGAGVLSLFGVLTGLLALAKMGGISYAARLLFGYRNTRAKYQLNLTRSLYAQNLDNSAGVLLRLTDEAEEQEFHEAVLAYFLLWREAPAEGWTETQLDDAAEAYLQQLCGYGVDFEVGDAIHKLERLGLAKPTGDDRWRVVGVRDALLALDEAWDRYFDFKK